MENNYNSNKSSGSRNAMAYKDLMPELPSFTAVSPFQATPGARGREDAIRSSAELINNSIHQRFNNNDNNSIDSKLGASESRIGGLFNNDMIKKSMEPENGASKIRSHHHPGSTGNFSFSTDKKKHDLPLSEYAFSDKFDKSKFLSANGGKRGNLSASLEQRPFQLEHLDNSYEKGSLSSRSPQVGNYNRGGGRASQGLRLSPKTHSPPLLASSSSASNMRDLKNSNSYIMAMRALQSKIKNVESELEKKNNELNTIVQAKQQEIDGMRSKVMEERSSSSRLENNLKHKLQTVENEINERQRLIDSLTEENASLRNNLSQNNANHNKEFEGLVMEKAALKSQMHELESQLSDQVRGNEDALRKIYELEQNSDKYEMELKYLQDKVRKLEGDKNDQKNHFDQRIIEVASHNNQLERKLYESQSEGELELRSALKREENLKEDLDRLKKQVDDLTTQRQDKDQELKDTKVDMKKKDADIATLREEIQNLIKENIKTKAVSDYSRSFVNDVTSVNEKLINTLLENTKQPLSSVAGSVSQFNFGDPKSRHDFTIKESSIAESEGSRSPKPKELSGKRLLNDSITTGTDTSPKDLDDYRSNSTSTLNPHNNYATFSGIPVTKSTYKTPDGKSFGSGEKNGQLKSGGGGGGGNSAKANRKSSVTWADDGSQQQDRLASPENLYYNNSRNSSVKTKDLFSNELLKNSIQSGGKNRENSETRRGRSPQTDFNERQQQQRKENSEDKFEYENLIKAIIDMEKEILTLNKEYQNVSNEVTGKEDNSKVKRHLGEITQKLQIKSEELIKLKKKEEGMMSKFNF